MNKAHKTPPLNVIDVDAMATMLSLPSWEKIDEMNHDYYGEAGTHCDDEDHEHEGDPPCDKCGRGYPQRCLTCETAASDETCRQWHDAVTSAFQTIMSRHGLVAQPLRGEDKRLPFRWRLRPEISWDDAALKIVETINGVGHFYYPSVREFARVNCTTPRGAVLSHLAWCRHQPEVYGDVSANALYERAWR